MKLKIDAHFAREKTDRAVTALAKHFIKYIENEIKEAASHGEYEVQIKSFDLYGSQYKNVRQYQLTLFDYMFYQDLLYSLNSQGYKARIFVKDDGKILEISWRPSVVSEE